MAGLKSMLNNKGEWNICTIPRLVLDYKEPKEENLSNKRSAYFVKVTVKANNTKYEKVSFT